MFYSKKKKSKHFINQVIQGDALAVKVHEYFQYPIYHIEGKVCVLPPFSVQEKNAS